MNNYLLLIGISCLPAVTGMCATLPLWYQRHLRNQPAARNHERKFGNRIRGHRTQQHQFLPLPPLRTPALHIAVPRLPPCSAPHPRHTPQNLQASLQALRTLYRLARITARLSPNAISRAGSRGRIRQQPQRYKTPALKSIIEKAQYRFSTDCAINRNTAATDRIANGKTGRAALPEPYNAPRTSD